MGKGQIISGGDAGQYQVKIVYNRGRYDAVIAALAEKKTKLEENRVPIQTDQADKSAEVDTAVAELNTLITELAELYTDLEVLQTSLATLRTELTVLEQELKDLQEQEPPAPEWTITQKQEEIAEKKTAISDKQTDISDKEKEINEKQTEVEEKQKEANDLSFQLALLDQQLAEIDLSITAIDKKTEWLTDQMPEDETVSAWCADLTEDLSGYVGTVEVPGELGEKGTLQIQPGYEDNAVWNQTRDGQLFPTVAMTPAQAFYNAAMLPGWQKWAPTFRHGVITAIDTETDTASVTLDAAATSSAQDLNINQTATIAGVEFEYMECGGNAFAVDDVVLIMFTNQLFATPKIIGFKEEPKTCCEMVETFAGGVYEWDWYTNMGDSAIKKRDGEEEGSINEYYLEIDAGYGGSIKLLYDIDVRDGGGSETRFWTHTDLNLTINITDVTLKQDLMGDPGWVIFFIATDEDDEAVRETITDGDSDIIIDKLDLSQEPYVSQLAGQSILRVGLICGSVEAKLNYFKLCANAGAASMPEQE